LPIISKNMMSKISRSIIRTKYFLPALIAVYIMVLVYSGLFAPTPDVIAPVGFFLGLFYFFLVYSATGKFSLKADAYLFLTALLSSFLGTVLILGTCQFITKPVFAPISFRAQVFGNFAFPLLVITILWISIRVPLFFKKR
jgi:hypothetical protein